jgi:addiction module HigA family antidote
MTQKDAAGRLHISYPRMNEIINGKRSVTPDTALPLARLTKTDAEFWLDLQSAVDLWDALHSEAIEEIRTIEPAVA